MTLRRLCKHFGALPSQIMGEDAALMLQLLELESIIEDEAERARAERMWSPIPEGSGHDG